MKNILLVIYGNPYAFMMAVSHLQLVFLLLAAVYLYVRKSRSEDIIFPNSLNISFVVLLGTLFSFFAYRGIWEREWPTPNFLAEKIIGCVASVLIIMSARKFYQLDDPSRRVGKILLNLVSPTTLFFIFFYLYSVLVYSKEKSLEFFLK